MMTTSHASQGEGLLVRRMHRARVRQWVVAGSSVIVTAFGVAFLSPDEIGLFAYYTLLALMLFNAMIALLQSAFVLFPIEVLLGKIRRAERDVDKGKLDVGHFTINTDDVFACLTAGVDNLVSKLSEKARASNERALLGFALLHAMPFAIFTVSKAGKVLTVVKDQYGLVSLLGIKVDGRPEPDLWGRENADRYLQEVSRSFERADFRWFDLNIGTHCLRGSVKRINELSAVVVLGDMPAIDALVSGTVGSSDNGDYTHHQEMLKRFAASIAHDGKNVFAALSHLIELNRLSTDPHVREQVPAAEDAIRRGTTLMTELTTFAGETRFDLVCTPAEDGIRAIVQSLTIKALIPENVQMIPTFSGEALPEVDLDADQTWKVFANLIKNSVEAMNGKDGHIWIKVDPFQLTDEAVRLFRHADSLRTGKGVMVTLADDGPGISSELLERIFDPYISTKGEGRGIGLATVLSIVDAHSGALRVKSSPGLGTSFHIFLPASRNTAAEITLMREIAPNGEILLVDDDPTILHTTGLVLRALKMAAHPASERNEAVAKLRSLRSRLRAVLVDANLGSGCSAGLVRQFHEEFPSLPVIVVSGAPKETVDEQFAGVRYERFLSKPYSIPELSKALKEVAPQT